MSEEEDAFGFHWVASFAASDAWSANEVASWPPERRRGRLLSADASFDLVAVAAGARVTVLRGADLLLVSETEDGEEDDDGSLRPLPPGSVIIPDASEPVTAVAFVTAADGGSAPAALAVAAGVSVRLFSVDALLSAAAPARSACVLALPAAVVAVQAAAHPRGLMIAMLDVLGGLHTACWTGDAAAAVSSLRVLLPRGATAVGEAGQGSGILYAGRDDGTLLVYSSGLEAEPRRHDYSALLREFAGAGDAMVRVLGCVWRLPGPPLESPMFVQGQVGGAVCVIHTSDPARSRRRVPHVDNSPDEFAGFVAHFSANRVAVLTSSCEADCETLRDGEPMSTVDYGIELGAGVENYDLCLCGVATLQRDRGPERCASQILLLDAAGALHLYELHDPLPPVADAAPVRAAAATLPQAVAPAALSNFFYAAGSSAPPPVSLLSLSRLNLGAPVPSTSGDMALPGAGASMATFGSGAFSKPNPSDSKPQHSDFASIFSGPPSGTATSAAPVSAAVEKPAANAPSSSSSSFSFSSASLLAGGSMSASTNPSPSFSSSPLSFSVPKPDSAAPALPSILGAKSVEMKPIGSSALPGSSTLSVQPAAFGSSASPVVFGSASGPSTAAGFSISSQSTDSVQPFVFATAPSAFGSTQIAPAGSMQPAALGSKMPVLSGTSAAAVSSSLSATAAAADPNTKDAAPMTSFASPSRGPPLSTTAASLSSQTPVFGGLTGAIPSPTSNASALGASLPTGSTLGSKSGPAFAGSSLNSSAPMAAFQAAGLGPGKSGMEMPTSSPAGSATALKTSPATTTVQNPIRPLSSTPSTTAPLTRMPSSKFLESKTLPTAAANPAAAPPQSLGDIVGRAANGFERVLAALRALRADTQCAVDEVAEHVGEPLRRVRDVCDAAEMLVDGNLDLLEQAHRRTMECDVNASELARMEKELFFSVRDLRDANFQRLLRAVPLDAQSRDMLRDAEARVASFSFRVGLLEEQVRLVVWRDNTPGGLEATTTLLVNRMEDHCERQTASLRKLRAAAAMGEPASKPSAATPSAPRPRSRAPAVADLASRDVSDVAAALRRAGRARCREPVRCLSAFQNRDVATPVGADATADDSDAAALWLSMPEAASQLSHMHSELRQRMQSDLRAIQDAFDRSEKASARRAATAASAVEAKTVVVELVQQPAPRPPTTSLDRSAAVDRPLLPPAGPAPTQKPLRSPPAAAAAPVASGFATGQLQTASAAPHAAVPSSSAAGAASLKTSKATDGSADVGSPPKAKPTAPAVSSPLLSSHSAQPAVSVPALTAPSAVTAVAAKSAAANPFAASAVPASGAASGGVNAGIGIFGGGAASSFGTTSGFGTPGGASSFGTSSGFGATSGATSGANGASGLGSTVSSAPSGGGGGLFNAGNLFSATTNKTGAAAPLGGSTASAMPMASSPASGFGGGNLFGGAGPSNSPANFASALSPPGGPAGGSSTPSGFSNLFASTPSTPVGGAGGFGASTPLVQGAGATGFGTPSGFGSTMSFGANAFGRSSGFGASGAATAFSGSAMQSSTGGRTPFGGAAGAAQPSFASISGTPFGGATGAAQPSFASIGGGGGGGAFGAMPSGSFTQK